MDPSHAHLRSQALPRELERSFDLLRVAVMVSGTIVFPFVADRPDTHPTLAYVLLGLGWVYSLVVLILRPRRSLPSVLSSWVTVPSDITMTLLWIAATGGGASPWIVALFVLVITASIRFRPRDTLLTAAFATAGYLVVLEVTGELSAHLASAVVTSIYLLLAAGVCALISHGRLANLAAQLELHDLTQEVAQVGSWEWRISADELLWSTELKRIFGLAPAARPTLASYFAAIHPDDRGRLQQVVDGALSTRTPFQIEHRIVIADGTIRWLHCRGRVLTSDDGVPVGIIGSSQDITDTKKIQEQLLAGRKLASLGTLASGIAHEINNPLAYVATSLELARRRIEAARHGDAHALEASLAAAQDGCRRVAEIVRGLGIFSRVDGDPSAPVELAAVADSALAIASHEIGQRARLVRQYQPAPAVVGTEARLLQVVLNLVINAAHAVGAEARSTHEIRIRIEPTDDGRVLLAVSDTGSGIAVEHLPRIFDPFFTTKAPGVGMGLGLSICQGIVRDLGGELEVETAAGVGSTFSVRLPAATRAADEPSITADHDTKLPARRLRVLIVDDEQPYAKALGALLEASYEVEIATDGGRALSLLCEDSAFDAILCDLMMTGISGADLYEAVESIHPELASRIVFLTSGATSDRARTFLQRPEVRCLAKPAEIRAIEREIRATLH